MEKINLIKSILSSVLAVGSSIALTIIKKLNSKLVK